MAGWQIPGVPSMPSPADALRLIQLQTELLTELPETLAELTCAVRGLADTVEAAKAMVASANRAADRLDGLLDDLQEPVQGLRPGIERVNRVLDAPVIERLPAILELVDSAVVPVAQSTERMRNRLARIRRLGRRTSGDVSIDGLGDARRSI